MICDVDCFGNRIIYYVVAPRYASSWKHIILYGAVSERLKETVLKTVGCKSPLGSNPSCVAIDSQSCRLEQKVVGSEYMADRFYVIYVTRYVVG